MSMKRYIYGDPEAPRILIQPVDDHDLSGIENEFAKIREIAGDDLCLIAFQVSDWNHDLSPWTAPAVFGKEDFGDGARSTLEDILEEVKDDNKSYYIGGYSLAGLFALWAVCQTDAFAGAAAASPSVWFPGFTDYVKENPVRTGSVYLSLGDKEERTRNPVMATVGDRIRELYEHLSGQNIRCVLEWNAGNHFMEADIRTAKAFAWLLKQ